MWHSELLEAGRYCERHGSENIELLLRRGDELGIFRRGIRYLGPIEHVVGQRPRERSGVQDGIGIRQVEPRAERCRGQQERLVKGRHRLRMAPDRAEQAAGFPPSCTPLRRAIEQRGERLQWRRAFAPAAGPGSGAIPPPFADSAPSSGRGGQ